VVTDTRPGDPGTPANGSARERLTPFRGEVWWLSLGGHHPAKAEAHMGARRPVLVIQNNVGNARATTVIVAAVSSVVPEKRYPQLVALDTEVLGLPATVRCDVIETVERIRLIERAAVLPREVMAEVDAALRRSLALK